MTIMARTVTKLQAAAEQLVNVAAGAGGEPRPVVQLETEPRFRYTIGGPSNGGAARTVSFVQCDVTDAAAVPKAFDAAERNAGAPVDVLVRRRLRPPPPPLADVRAAPRVQICAAGVSQPGYLLDQEVGSGWLALSRCTTAHPLHTRFTNEFGIYISETRVRPNQIGACVAVAMLRKARKAAYLTAIDGDTRLENTLVAG